MKYSIYILLIISFLLAPSWSNGQVISYGCNDEQSNSTEQIRQVQVRALDPSRMVETDELIFDVPSNTNCFVYEDDELEIYNQINYDILIDNPPSRTLYFLILVDWNGDGEYQLQGADSEVVASGQTMQGSISGMITPPDNCLSPGFNSRVRIIIADEQSKLFEPSMSTTVEFGIRGSDPKVTISKDGNNLRPNPLDHCMPFNNYDQLVFQLENVSSPSLNLNVQIESILLTDLTTNQDYVVNIINDDELIVLDKITASGSDCGVGTTCNIPYGVGQVFNMDNTDIIVLALAWDALRTRLPDLREFPLKPKLYKATITVKILSHTTTTECLYIGCCKENELELNTETVASDPATWLPLYVGAAGEIEIYGTGTGLVEVFTDYQSVIRSESFIRLGPGFHAQNGSFVHAYIDDCPTVPSDGDPVFRNGTNAINNTSLIPDHSSISTNKVTVRIFPNPTAENTVLTYHLTETMPVKIVLLNGLGEEMKVIEVEPMQAAGDYQVTLNTQNLNPGIYFYQLRIGQQREVLKLVKR